MSTQMSSLDVLPEEIVERILLQVVQSLRAVPPPSGLAPRCAVLLTCRKWYRIALPLFYHTVYIKGERQAAQLLATLQNSQVEFSVARKAAEHTQQIGSFIRSLVISCPLSCQTLPQIVSQCTELTDLDICLDAKTFGGRHNPVSASCGAVPSSISSPSPADAFLASLSSLDMISHLTLRKDASVYLTLPKVGHFISRLAGCVRQWNDLHSIYIAFRLSDDAASTTLLPSVPAISDDSSSPSTTRSPLASLTHALAHSPRLESVTTHLPSVWNSVLVGLIGSEGPEASGSDHEEIKSPNLKKIVLLPGAGSPKPNTMPTFSPRSPYARPSSQDFPTTRTTIATPLPGHGLGLSIMPSSSAPSPSTIPSLPEKAHDAPPPPLPTNSLYLSTAARHHPKLMELIRAGWTDAFSTSALAGNSAWYGAGRGRAWTYAGE